MHKIVRVFLFLLLFLSYPFAFATEQQNKDSFSFYEANFSTQWISDHNFVYNSDLINFDLREYLKTNAPHLWQHTEFISHWSGYYSINPKVLLTLIDM